VECRKLLRVFAIVLAVPFATACSREEEDKSSSPVVTVRASENEVTPADPLFEDDQGEQEEPVADAGARDTGERDEDCGCDTLARTDSAEADAGDPGEGQG
jgi:hypothetical protein